MTMQSLAEVLHRARARSAERRAMVSPETIERVNVIPEPKCELCLDRGWLRCDVPLDHPSFGQMVPCSCQHTGAMAEQHRRNLEQYSNLGPMLGYRLDAVDPERYILNPANRRAFADALAAAKEYADNPVGWLTLVGPSSSGKTYLAAGIANRRIELGHPALFVTANNLVDFLRSGLRETGPELMDFQRQATDAELLVLDDLPTHHSSNWAQERLMMILSDRHVYGRPTVITLRGEPNRADELLRTRIETVDGFARVYRLGRHGLTSTGVAGDIPAGMRDRMRLEFFQQLGNSDVPGAPAWALRFIREWSKQELINTWVCLFGPTGVGKTHLAVGAALERERMGDDVFFATFSDMLDYLRSSFNPETTYGTEDILAQIRTTDLLVLDDLGAEHSTSWAEEKLFQIVNFRYEERLPTIITTSLRLQDLYQYRERIASRLHDRRVVNLVPVEADDYRRLQQEV